MHNVDEMISCEATVANHLETLQVFDCSLILAIERSRPNVCLHERLLACRTLELCVDGEIGQRTFGCRER